MEGEGLLITIGLCVKGVITKTVTKSNRPGVFITPEFRREVDGLHLQFDSAADRCPELERTGPVTTDPSIPPVRCYRSRQRGIWVWAGRPHYSRRDTGDAVFEAHICQTRAEMGHPVQRYYSTRRREGQRTYYFRTS